MQIADTIILRPVAALIPYARNPRTHSDAQVAQIAASIREFGFTNPVLVDEAGGIIAGHGRVMAAQLLGMDAVPTIELGYLTETQRRAYVIADNKLALNAGWDEELLRLELASLIDEGFDPELAGFSELELDELLLVRSGDLAGGQNNGNLAERFGIPPFSVLNAREGWWQGRKAAWIALGIKSELGRGELASDRNESGSARINDAADGRRRYAVPGGGLMPAVDRRTGLVVRSDSKARPIPGTAPKRARHAAQG
jgi:hypothetical protein